MIYSLFRNRGPLFLPTVGILNGLKMGSTRFSWRYFAFFAVQLSIIFHKVSGKGLFQLRLISFKNDFGLDIHGNCCDGSPYRTDRQCSSPCRTYFKICLFNYVQEIRTDPFPKCTYGNTTTNIIGNNSFRIPSNDSDGFIQLPFDFAWRNDFSLIVDAWHTNVSNSKNMTQESNSKLLTRLATQRNQDVSPVWTHDRYNSTDHNHTLQYSYRVVCDDNYYGAGCTRRCVPHDDIIGHYTCGPDGSKICLDGWQGPRCTEAICTNGCDHGRCLGPNMCECDAGYQGDSCDECKPRNGCVHGTCDEPNECNCFPGWAGSLCSIDTDYCTKHTPCQNGGTCRNQGSLGYTCYCAEGFTGANCQEEAVTPQCYNGGTPVNIPNHDPPCICPAETIGDRCQLYIRRCDPDPCQNGGTCTDQEGDGPEGFQCLCSDGFVGAECEIVDHCASQPCANGATCRNLETDFACECPTGFVGDTCQLNICENHECYNGGNCLADFEGARCQCPSGFKGEQCEVNVDDCVGNPCENGGTCQDLINSFRCKCGEGYFGDNCEKRECPGPRNPCANGGTCSMDSVGGFTCSCAEGFSGLFCENATGDSTHTQQPPVVTTEIEMPQTNIFPSTKKEEMTKLMQIIKMVAFIIFGILIVLTLSCLTIVIYKKQRSERTSRDLENNPAPPNNRAVLTYTDNFSNSEKVLPLLSISEKVCNKEIEQDNLKATHFKHFSSSNSSSNTLSKNSISKDYKIKDYSSKEFECLQNSGENRASCEDCSVVRYVPQTRHSLPRNCDSEEICNSDEFYYYDEKKVALKRTDSLHTNSQSSSLESTPKHTAKCPILQISAVVEDNFPAPVLLHATEV